MVVLAHTGTKLCLAAVLERYCTCMAITSVSPSESDSFLLRTTMQTKNGSKLRSKGGLSYTTVCEAVLAKLEAIGLHVDKHKYGLQSLRAGGATAGTKTAWTMA